MQITTLLISTLSLIYGAHSLKVSMYSNSECRSTALNAEVSKPGDGCQSVGSPNYGSLFNRWQAEEDNDFLLVTYSDDKCCHGDTVQAFGWEEECLKVEPFSSFRIVSSSEPDKGKDGQEYICGLE